MLSKVVASAPGKVILFGEHFVVENQPAIAVALSRRARVTVTPREDKVFHVSSRELGLEEDFGLHESRKESPLYPIVVAARAVENIAGTEIGVDIRIESEIPPSAGMGSSAAVAVATAAAVAELLGLNLDRERISNIAYRAETIVHGKPSGIDNTVSTFGGAIAFRKSEGFLRLEADFTPVKIILADTGIPRNTGELVRRVLSLKNKYPKIFDPIYYAAGRLSVEAAKLMERGEYEAVGELMNVNHGLLSAIGVSILELEDLVYTARRAGALGAKITGAGGGGFVVALTRREDSEKVARALGKVAKRVIVGDISEEGVKIEEKA